MHINHYDLIVFGSGNAISTAIECGAAGMKVALIERGPLGILTAELGHRLFFLSAMEMARRLGAAFRENRLPRAMKMLTQPRLLIIDEVGYLGLDQAGHNFSYEVSHLRGQARGTGLSWQ